MTAVTALVLLDLLASFDAVDRGILLSHVGTDMVVKGTALLWFWSYYSGNNEVFS